MNAIVELAKQIAALLQAAPNAMTLQVARQLGVPEEEVIRNLPEGWSVELDRTRWEDLMRDFAPLGEVHVIVTNGAVTLESVGTFGGFSTWDEFFNVQSPTLDMHIRYPNLGAIFAVAKPSHMTGLRTLSFQFYDQSGHAAMKVFLSFGAKKPPPEVQAAFESLRDKYRLAV